MSRLPKSALALGLLLTLAPLPALAHDRENSDSGSSATVIQYDPHSSDDIYESPDAVQYQANRSRYEERYEDRYEDGQYRRYRKVKKKHRRGHGYGHSRHGNEDYNYQSGQQYPVSGSIYRQPTYPQSCTFSRSGTVCR
jgi:hypothetical protein